MTSLRLCAAAAAVALAGAAAIAVLAAEIGGASDPAAPIAWVGERPSDLDGSRFDGRFAVRLDPADAASADPPNDLSLEDALAWARRHADVVYLQVNGATYSAGRRHPVSERPRWVDGTTVEPRPLGTAIDGSQQERSWPLELQVRTDIAPAAAAALLQQLGAADVVVEPADQGMLAISCTVRGSAAGDVLDAASEEIESAFLAVDPDALLVSATFQTGGWR
ncbi:MAG TPA: hypothetical protein VLK58_07465 [Conexibacter sp.]|nr:hypothetical protein [Conexibacter sp.]